jgi:DNA-binding transcriptional regulator YiaG
MNRLLKELYSELKKEGLRCKLGKTGIRVYPYNRGVSLWITVSRSADFIVRLQDKDVVTQPRKYFNKQPANFYNNIDSTIDFVVEWWVKMKTTEPDYAAEMKCLRESMGLTAGYIAKRMKVDAVTIYQWENNNRVNYYMKPQYIDELKQIKEQIFDKMIYQRVKELETRPVEERIIWVDHKESTHKDKDGNFYPLTWSHSIGMRVKEQVKNARIQYTKDKEAEFF